MQENTTTMAGAAVEGDLVAGAVVAGDLVTRTDTGPGVVRIRFYRLTGGGGAVLLSDQTHELPDEPGVERLAEVIPFPVYRRDAAHLALSEGPELPEAA